MPLPPPQAGALKRRQRGNTPSLSLPISSILSKYHSCNNYLPCSSIALSSSSSLSSDQSITSSYDASSPAPSLVLSSSPISSDLDTFTTAPINSSSDTTTSTFDMGSSSPPASTPSTTSTSATSTTSSSNPISSTTTPPTASSSHAPSSSSAIPNNRVTTHTNSNTGAIAGGVVGGIVFLACVVAGLLYFRRIRARKHRMAPSAEFMDSVHKGAPAPPIFRLRSGAEYMTSTPDHVGSLPGTPVPFPFMQDSYKDHKIPGMAVPDFNARKSLPPPPHVPFSDYHPPHPVYEASGEGMVSGVPSAWHGVEQPYYEPYLQDSYMNPDVADMAAPPEDMRPQTGSGSGHHAKDNSLVALIPVRRSVDIP